MSATVGDSIEIYWPLDKEYYGAKVAAFNSVDHLYTLHYFDGEVEDINLTEERWRWIEKHKKNPNSFSPEPNPEQQLPWLLGEPKKEQILAVNHSKGDPVAITTPPIDEAPVIQQPPVKQKKVTPRVKNQFRMLTVLLRLSLLSQGDLPQTLTRKHRISQNGPVQATQSQDLL